MEELSNLRLAIEQKRYNDTLMLVAEMEEMRLEYKINIIQTFALTLLLYLIKQQAEQRSTCSWKFSIFNAVFEIQKVNRRRKSGGYYIGHLELHTLLNEVYSVALKKATLEAFEGQYSSKQLAKK